MHHMSLIIATLLLAGWVWTSAAVAAQSCTLAPQQDVLSRARGLGAPCITHCLLGELGQPKTEAERLLAYLSAVGEYCASLSSDVSLCQGEPLCQLMLLAGNTTVDANSIAANWWQALTRHTQLECWPNWLVILNQECTGSKHAQMQQCLDTEAGLLAVSRISSSWPGLIPQDMECPSGCILTQLRHRMPEYGRRPLYRGGYTRSSCVPTWVLQQVCGGRSCVAAASEAPGCVPWQVESYEDTVDSNSALGVSCQVAIAYVRSASWAALQGSCPHRVTVAQLLQVVQKELSGDGCSLVKWVANSTKIDQQVAWVRVCGRKPTYPSDNRWAPKPDAITQAVLMQCPSGYKRMHAALSELWRAPELHSRLLAGPSSWGPRLLHASDVCGRKCVRNSSALDMPPANLAWNALADVMQSYCESALAADTSQVVTPRADDGAQLGCAGALANLRRNWHQHVLLAAVWLVYVVGLVLGLLALHFIRRCLPGNSSGGCVSGGMVQGGLVAPCVCGHSVCGWLAHWGQAAAPSYHTTGQQGHHPISAASRALCIIRACWFAADIVLDAFILRTVVGLMAGLGVWLLGVLCAQAVAAMLFAMPGVLSAYGFLDFARVRFSICCSALVFISCAWVMFLLVIAVAGAWFIFMADLYMLVALCGVPEHKLLGNQLNVGAYTTLRYLCQGVVQALPSALIKTATMEALLVTDVSMCRGRFYGRARCRELLWASLLLSMSRFAGEVFSLALLTYRLQASCFVAAVIDVVHYLQLQQPQGVHQAPALRSRPDVKTQDSQPCITEGAGIMPDQQGVAEATRQATSSGLNTVSSVSEGVRAADQQEHMPTALTEQAAEGAAACESGAVVQHTAVQVHDHTSPAAQPSPAGCCGRHGCAGDLQHYPRFTVVYVWVLSLLVAAFVCVVCSHAIWPWMFNGARPLASMRPYSLFNLWGNWKLSGSVKGSLKALGGCDVGSITCNLTAV